MKSKIAPQDSRDCRTPTYEETCVSDFDIARMGVTHHLTLRQSVLDDAIPVLFAGAEEPVGQHNRVDEAVNHHYHCDNCRWGPVVRRNVISFLQLLFNGQLHDLGGSLAYLHLTAAGFLCLATNTIDMVTTKDETEQQRHHEPERSPIAVADRASHKVRQCVFGE